MVGERDVSGSGRGGDVNDAGGLRRLDEEGDEHGEGDEDERPCDMERRDVYEVRDGLLLPPLEALRDHAALFVADDE